MKDHNTIHVKTIQKFIANLLGHTHCEVKSLGAGATSRAWLISCRSDQFVLRTVHSTTNRPITYRSEFLILQNLYKQGLPVPEPLYNSFEQTFQLDEHTSAWAITRLVAGKPILNNKLTPKVARQLGTFLKVFHQLPCSKFGRLNEKSDHLIGKQTSPIEGIRARWCWAQLWLFDNSALSEHPITTLAPTLLNPLKAIETTLWDIATKEDAVLAHSDLYGEHIFVDEGNLSGVIDFGATFIGARSWDFAVLAHYHGWETVETILQTYCKDRSEYSDLLQKTHYLTIIVGLYKLEKAVRIKRKISKQERITQFISDTLSKCQR